MVARGRWSRRDPGGPPGLAVAGDRTPAWSPKATVTQIAPDAELPVGSMGRHANGWWGVVTLITTEGALFGYLLFAYPYLAAQNTARSGCRRFCRGGPGRSL